MLPPRSIIITIMTNFRNETKLKCLESETWAINTAPEPATPPFLWAFLFISYLKVFPTAVIFWPLRNTGRGGRKGAEYLHFMIQQLLGPKINIYLTIWRERKSEAKARQGKWQAAAKTDYEVETLTFTIIFLMAFGRHDLHHLSSASECLLHCYCLFCPIMIRLSAARKAGIKVNFMLTFCCWLANRAPIVSRNNTMWAEQGLLFGATLNISIRSYCRAWKSPDVGQAFLHFTEPGSRDPN